MMNHYDCTFGLSLIKKWKKKKERQTEENPNLKHVSEKFVLSLNGVSKK